MTEIQLTLEDEELTVPAARCRGCGALTHQCSLLEGIKAVKTPQHHKGCRKPPGRTHLKVFAEALPRRDHREVWRRRLDHMLWDSEVKTLADELLAQLGEVT